MKTMIAIAVAGIATSANADVLFSEILGSTGGPDAEYIELGNFGPNAVDISGWSIEFWDSDDASIGEQDGGSPYFVAAGTVLEAGETWTFLSGQAASLYTSGMANGNVVPTSFNGQAFGGNQGLQANAIENSSYTAVLVDAMGNTVESWFFGDGDAADFANRGGAALADAIIVPLDGGGMFQQSGYARTAVDSFVELNFSTPGFGAVVLNDGTIEGGTPGVTQFAFVPAPGTVALLGLAGLVANRRR